MVELFDAPVTLERFAGKGGWTYAPVGSLPVKVRTHFGVLKVSGWVDGVAFENRTLMPMGQGRRFLPVSALLRKQLGKQAGDVVRLRLVAAAPTASAISLADLLDCLAEAPAALSTFQNLLPTQRQQWLNWVMQAPSDEQRVTRIEVAMARLSPGTTDAEAHLPPSTDNR